MLPCTTTVITEVVIWMRTCRKGNANDSLQSVHHDWEIRQPFFRVRKSLLERCLYVNLKNTSNHYTNSFSVKERNTQCICFTASFWNMFCRKVTAFLSVGPVSNTSKVESIFGILQRVRFFNDNLMKFKSSTLNLIWTNSFSSSEFVLRISQLYRGLWGGSEQLFHALCILKC